MTPLIGIPACQRIKTPGPIHHVGEKYVNAVVNGVRGLPVLIPACGDSPHLAELITRLDRYEPAHALRLTPGGVLARLFGAEEVEVNSLHAQGIDRLGKGLVAEATAPDGLIEAVSIAGSRGFALGVQWHPEYPSLEAPV